MEQQVLSAADMSGHHVSKVTDELRGKLPQIHPFTNRRIDLTQGRRRIAADDALYDARKAAVLGGAEHRVDIFHGNLLAAERQQLFEQRLAVTHRPRSAA